MNTLAQPAETVLYVSDRLVILAVVDENLHTGINEIGVSGFGSYRRVENFESARRIPFAVHNPGELNLGSRIIGVAPSDLSQYAFRIEVASCAAIGSCQKETQTWMVGVAKHGRFQTISMARSASERP